MGVKRVRHHNGPHFFECDRATACKLAFGARSTMYGSDTESETYQYDSGTDEDVGQAMRKAVIL